jgi:hypothetical protein
MVNNTQIINKGMVQNIARGDWTTKSARNEAKNTKSARPTSKKRTIRKINELAYAKARFDKKLGVGQ